MKLNEHVIIAGNVTGAEPFFPELHTTPLSFVGIYGVEGKMLHLGGTADPARAPLQPGFLAMPYSQSAIKKYQETLRIRAVGLRFASSSARSATR